MLDRREVAILTLYGDLDNLPVMFCDIEEALQVNRAVTMMKSALGFMINEVYDGIMEVSEGKYIDFLRLVYSDIDDKNIRLMLIQLYHKLPIEENINDYVLESFDQFESEKAYEKIFSVR
jgi:hypothetical protein